MTATTIPRLRVEGRSFRDQKNREVTIRGINVDGSSKFPTKPCQPSHVGGDEFFSSGDHVSFVGRPFALEEAPSHFAKLKNWGFNEIRYIFTWEAIEHEAPGKYDEEWVDFTIEVLRIAKQYGFLVHMDSHQDAWSRYMGGSGAPLWTIYAIGMNPRNFLVTEAALVHNTWPKPETFKKMIWSTNYTRLACLTVNTLFWAGRDFAPKAIIDGKNIQDYLQDHYFNACRHLAQRIHDAGDLEDETVIGWESLNEPNRGLIGYDNIEEIPSQQKLQLGTSPTAFEAMLTGSGRACQISEWEFGPFGPRQVGQKLVDPKGTMAWLSPGDDGINYDQKYGWHRDPQWRLGECIWAQHGVWDPRTGKPLRSDYFASNPQTGKALPGYEAFTEMYFMPFYRRFKEMVRSVHANAIMFCQPPILEVPPDIKGTEDDDENMVHAVHYYDGFTLMTKKWNRFFNVDVVGVLRGAYKWFGILFALRFGESAIRNCIRDQLRFLRNESRDLMGNRPVILTEIGIPFDMNDKSGYKTGDYSSQISAMDANYYAVEGSGMNGMCLWNYTAKNSHKWADLWNGEDLSVVSIDDDKHAQGSADQRRASSKKITRAAQAFIRPSAIATNGNLVGSGFDLTNQRFELVLKANKPAKEDAPTLIYLPELHYPDQNKIEVTVSDGRWEMKTENVGLATIQMLEWWHGAGKQIITVSRKR